MKNLTSILLSSFLFSAAYGATANASPQQDNIAYYAQAARAVDNGFSGFSSERGRLLFLARPASGKEATPSCTTCHGEQPTGRGETRAGKVIEPMALSVNPERYADPKKLEKWFLRNCNSVLGRECTAIEKGDFLTFMVSQ